MAIKFKDQEKVRLENEWNELQQKNMSLVILTNHLSKFVEKNFKKNIVITCILRTQEEQEKIYGKDTKKVSPHMLFSAIDLRSSIYTKSEIKEIVDWLNSNYNKNNGYSTTCIYHEVKNFGMHFHIQYVKK